jgi:hypothetical protein
MGEQRDPASFVDEVLAHTLHGAMGRIDHVRHWYPAFDIKGHRCVLGIQDCAYALLGYELSTGRIVGAALSRGRDGGRIPPRRTLASRMLAVARSSEFPDEPGWDGLGAVLLERFRAVYYPVWDVPKDRPSAGDLDRHLPDWRVLEEILGRLDPDVMGLSLSEGMTTAGYAWLSGRDALRARRLALFGGYSFLRNHLLLRTRLVDEMMAADAPDRVIALACLCETSPAFASRSGTRGGRRRLLDALEAIAGYPQDNAFQYLRALQAFVDLDIAWDRMPSTAADWVAFSFLDSLGGGLDPEDPDRRRRVLDVPGGRYAELWDRVTATDLGRNARENLLQQDWASAYPPDEVEGNLACNLSHVIHDDLNRMPARCADYLLTPLARHAGATLDRQAAVAIAASIVFRDRAAIGLCDAWADWMALQPGVSRVLARAAKAVDRKWPALTERNPLRRGRLDLRWLVTPVELIDEGTRGLALDGSGGLDHCVATYVTDAMSGRSHILSIRESGDDGVPRRLSTAEFTWNRDASGWLDPEEDEFSLVQHRGPGNGEPPAEAARAVRGVLAALNGGRLSVDPAARVREAADDGTDDPEEAFGMIVDGEELVEGMLRALEPLFPRDLRGLALGAFAERALNPREAVPPTP